LRNTAVWEIFIFQNDYLGINDENGMLCESFTIRTGHLPLEKRGKAIMMGRHVARMGEKIAQRFLAVKHMGNCPIGRSQRGL
jgi:hypothetical protein